MGGFDAYEALLRINPIAVSVLGALGCGVALGLHLLKVRESREISRSASPRSPSPASTR